MGDVLVVFSLRVGWFDIYIGRGREKVGVLRGGPKCFVGFWSHIRCLFWMGAKYLVFVIITERITCCYVFSGKY